MDLKSAWESSEPPHRVSRLAILVGLTGTLAVAAVAFTEVAAEGSNAGAAVGSAAAGALKDGSPDFWAHWGDGRAELDGYALTQPRYGQARSGTVVHVFVTEPFSYEARVKADPGRHPKSDTFPVLKLNEARDFQTGIYDYNHMTSVFVALGDHPKTRRGHPTKITFSGQEWCGMIFEQLRFEPKRIDQHRFSYFDGEGEAKMALDHPSGGVTMDELPIWLRGLTAGPPLAPGASTSMPILPSIQRTRMLHRELAWIRGEVARAPAPETVEVPYGRFEADRYTVRLTNGETWSYWVESAWPRRILRWDGPSGEKAELLGSDRLPYWQLHDEGHEKLLKRIGLPGTSP